ncbi:uncharacterized protein LOC126784415 isoform X2 [Argentina anserina]|uniref:uncharacterized protein LOC126784415 isoform X2 n=1 Tax=Argentina anserina TaxID=57926 RepID=UPI00217679A5|nr:uncharacterized protein LOC126784415 isoform X2 [Potentilla anserina]
MEGLGISDTNLKVFLHPSKSGDVNAAIHHELSSMIFKFDDNLDGALVAYKFDISSKDAKILNGVYPYFAVNLRAKLLLFSPKPNMLVEGKVVKVTRRSISVIVLGFSCAFIKEEDIREEFKYKNKRGKQVYISRYQKRHVIKVGTMIRLSVNSFDVETLHINGSLRSAHTGSIRFLDKDKEDDALTVRSKRRRENEGESVMQEPCTTGPNTKIKEGPGSTGMEAISFNSDQYIKKSKKHKTR